MIKIQNLTRLTSTLFFILVGSVIASSCTEKSSSNTDSLREVRIGVIAYNPLPEGEMTNVVNAVQMAVQEINSGIGLTLHGQKHKVTWVQEKVNAGVPEESVAAVQRLINQQNVVAIIGPMFSVDAIPAGEIAEISGIPLITPGSTNPRVTRDRKFVFRMGYLDEFQGTIAAYFARFELQVESAAVLYNIADPYSRGLAEVFRKMMLEVGGRIVAFESYAGIEDDITLQLGSIREKQPDLLYLPAFAGEVVKIAVKVREMKITGILLGGDSWDASTLASISEFDGAYMTAPYSDQAPGEKNLNFVTSFREKFGFKPGGIAALTYDAFHLLAASIQYKGSADPGSIRDGLYEMGPYEGVAGNVDFVENGDPVKGVVILQVIDGSVKYVDFMGGE